MIIDSHVHLNNEAFNRDIEGYIKSADKEGVKILLCIGSTLSDSLEAVEIANHNNNVYAAIGVHPTDTKNITEQDFVKLEQLLNNPKVIAVGEVGLDYFCEKKTEEIVQRQTYWFHKFIDLANKHHRPIIIHSREATNDTYEILKNHPVNSGGIIHCYSAGKEYVDRYIKLGYYFGIGGIVTFKNAVKMKEAVKAIPLNRLLLETDAPYLAPTPYRGQINHSKYLPLIIKEIALIKGVSNQEIEYSTAKNFEKLFL